MNLKLNATLKIAYNLWNIFPQSMDSQTVRATNRIHVLGLGTENVSYCLLSCWRSIVFYRLFSLYKWLTVITQNITHKDFMVECLIWSFSYTGKLGFLWPLLLYRPKSHTVRWTAVNLKILCHVKEHNWINKPIVYYLLQDIILNRFL